MIIFLAFILTLVVLGGAYYDLQQTEHAMKHRTGSVLPGGIAGAAPRADGTH